MIERALKLREAIDEFVIKQKARWTEYEERWQQAHGNKKRPPKKKTCPTIVADQLTRDDWTTLAD